MNLESLESRRVLAVVTVTTDQDVIDEMDGLVSLREAIMATNMDPGPDDINFEFDVDGPVVILLTQGELAITDPLTITGNGPALLTIDARGNDPTPHKKQGDGSRVFRVDDGNTAADSALSIMGMTLTGGDVDGVGGAILTAETLTLAYSLISGNSSHGDLSNGGGGVFSLGDITITSSTILGNSASRGGGVYAVGNVSANSSEITGNSSGDGGGIWAGGYATVTSSTVSDNDGSGIVASHVTVASSSISRNSAFSGGGIWARSDVVVRSSTVSDNNGSGIVASHVTVASSTISRNSAFSGGGIWARSDVVVTSSTISGNSANYGGGIRAYSVNMRNSTISGNSAESYGGGVYSFGTIEAVSSTITRNSAAYGGGLWLRDSAEISHTVVAGNTDGGSGPDLQPGTGPLAVEYSLIGDNAGTGLTEAPVGLPDANGNMIGGPINGVIDSLLGILIDNGGPTATHALLPGSPAIDAGDPAAMAGIGNTPRFDQRGSPSIRVLGDRMDIGAYEWKPPTAVDGDFNDDSLYDCMDIDQLIFAIAAGSNNRAFDMTGDGLVNLADRDAWLAEAGSVNLGPGEYYRPGDANLDGNVDVSDFNAWNEHKFSPLPVVYGWCEGNFNGDGVVDVADFNVWNENKFTGMGVLWGLPESSNKMQAVTRRPQHLTVITDEAGGNELLALEPPLQSRRPLAEFRSGTDWAETVYSQFPGQSEATRWRQYLPSDRSR